MVATSRILPPSSPLLYYVSPPLWWKTTPDLWFFDFFRASSGAPAWQVVVRRWEIWFVQKCLLAWKGVYLLLLELTEYRIVLGYLPTARIDQLGCCGVRWTSTWSGFVGLFNRRKGVRLPIDIVCIISAADYGVQMAMGNVGNSLDECTHPYPYGLLSSRDLGR